MGSATKQFEIVNTVNTQLNREYDFGIHAAGCQDVKRAARQGCTVDQIEVEDAAAAQQWIVDDLVDGGFEQEAAEMFSFRAFPCCGKG